MTFLNCTGGQMGGVGVVGMQGGPILWWFKATSPCTCPVFEIGKLRVDMYTQEVIHD